MGDENQSSKITVDVGASARAELKAEIPSTSMGRLVDALTDIIRPFSEWRGLKGDLIRLQREDVAVSIAKKAAEKIAESDHKPVPIPNKFLLPFLEASSLEGDSEELQEIWSSLLANTAVSADANSYYALSIVKEMTPAEADFLLLIHQASGLFKADKYDEYISGINLEFDRIFDHINSQSDSIATQENFLSTMNNLPGNQEIKSIIKNISVSFTKDNNGFSISRNILSDMDIFIDVLLARRIILVEEFSSGFKSQPYISGHHLTFTHLGFNFMRKILWQPSRRS